MMRRRPIGRFLVAIQTVTAPAFRSGYAPAPGDPVGVRAQVTRSKGCPPETRLAGVDDRSVDDLGANEDK
jgi:hypothetical protein